MVTVSPARPPIPGADDEAAGPVAGLARDLDALRRQLEPLTGLPERVDGLAGLLAEVTETVTALSARRGPTPCPSWLMLPADADIARRVLDELAVWLGCVYLRYPDGAQALPECWSWHPDVVEELLWLMYAWLAAYQGKAASVGLVADWHDRHRPGVARRIRAAAGSCSIEAHQTREGWTRYEPGPSIVPGAEAVPLVAQWWGPHRQQDAPEPGPITRASRR